MKYILKNKNQRTYLKLINKWKHYTISKEEATKFNITAAKAMMKKFKHNENWEMIEVK